MRQFLFQTDVVLLRMVQGMSQEFGKPTEVTIGPLLIVAIDQGLDRGQGVEKEMRIELGPDAAQGELGLLALAADAAIAEKEESEYEQNRNQNASNDL